MFVVKKHKVVIVASCRASHQTTTKEMINYASESSA